jgi:hypothetical protein
MRRTKGLRRLRRRRTMQCVITLHIGAHIVDHVDKTRYYIPSNNVYRPVCGAVFMSACAP